MDPFEKDIAYLKAGILEFENYLLSNELYWPITARGYDLPRLTIGGILLAKSQLDARGKRVEPVEIQLDRIHSKWRVAWETKASREVQARMRLWSNYLVDYRQNPEGHSDAYPHEVRYRVMLHLLMAELPDLAAERETLSQLDSILRANLIATDFIWDADLASGFSPKVYWFLYGKLKS